VSLLASKHREIRVQRSATSSQSKDEDNKARREQSQRRGQPAEPAAFGVVGLQHGRRQEPAAFLA
jgi:hypothetical protein